MAFPVVLSLTSTVDSSSGSADVADMPATVNSGDLLVAFMYSNVNNTHTAATGWTKIGESASNATVRRVSVHAKSADGTEGGGTATFGHTSGSDVALFYVYRIQTGTWSGNALATAVQAGFDNSTSSGDPDPPSLSPSYGAADTLWLIGGKGSVFGGTTVTPPTGYTDSSIISVSNFYQLSTARRELNASSEDPGVLDHATNSAWIGATVAIEPAAAAGGTKTSRLALLGVN